MVVVNDDGSKTSISYPKYLLIQNGIDVPSGYDVHHKNHDKTDDRLENLEIICHRQHTKNHVVVAEYVEFVCPECGIKAKKRADRVRHNRKQNKAGPFCGRSCAGKYSQKIQMKLRLSRGDGIGLHN